MDAIQLEKTCHLVCKIATETAQFIRRELGEVKSGDIETKSLNSLVSYVDKTAEEQLVAGLGQLIPEATFITEEETVENRRGTYQWIIDPLDGTTNFLHGLPFFSISIALQYQDETVLGVVYEVNREECFYGWQGGGAFLNQQRISVSTTPTLGDSLIATGFPYYDYSHVPAYLRVLEELMRGTRGLRRFGSAALDLAYVACGRFDAYFEYSLNSWDIAAGAFLVQEAGGQVSDFQQKGDFLENGEILASNSNLYTPLQSLIQSHFYSEE